MMRDFTFIDDIAESIVKLLDKVPGADTLNNQYFQFISPLRNF